VFTNTGFAEVALLDLQETCFGPRLVVCTWDSPKNRMPSSAEIENAEFYMCRAWHDGKGKVLSLDKVVDRGDGKVCELAPLAKLQRKLLSTVSFWVECFYFTFVLVVFSIYLRIP
jgi:hypothetical protein